MELKRLDESLFLFFAKLKKPTITMNTLIGKKLTQTQKFLENGIRIPVTVVDVADNTVVSIKTAEKDRYDAVQLGFGQKRKFTKALLGHAKKANLEKPSWLLREVRIKTPDDMTYTQGDTLKAIDTFKAGDIIKVTGFSKGKGFAGGVKRHGFKGGPRTHGQSDRERAPGSIGQTTTPGRVYKGKRMAGRMGSENVSVANLQIVGVDEAAKTLLIKGLIPGHAGSFVVISKTGEVSEKKFVPLLTDKDKKVSEVSNEEDIKVEEVQVLEETKEPKETQRSDEKVAEVEVSQDTKEAAEVKVEEPKKKEAGK